MQHTDTRPGDETEALDRVVSGAFEIDLQAQQLLRDDEPVHLEPQAFDVLAYLVTHRRRVVTKEELLDEVWGTRFVTEAALTTRVKTIRAALGDSGRRQHVIRTIHGRGYQFVAPVSVAPRPAASDPAPTTPSIAAGPGIDRTTHLGRLEGRDAELAELGALLEHDRLVTVVGPGGVGKTRLVGELDRPGGVESVVFVDLVPHRPADGIGPLLGQALGIEVLDGSDVIDAACEFLRHRRALVVVDNCEHVLTDAAMLIRRLLDGTQSVTVVATSRVPLGLRDERVLRLGSLPTPSIDLPAEQLAADACVSLFCDRARRVRHDFGLDEHNAAPVVGICRILDGLPLAIELAAARMGSLEPDELLSRLRRGLGILRDDRIDADERHRSLAALVEWSYGLLDDDARTMFDHLAVFPAGLVLDGMEWLGRRLDIDDPLGAVSALVDASLVVRNEHGSGVRYMLLETMRAAGVEHLRRDDLIETAYEIVHDGATVLFAWMHRTLQSGEEEFWNGRVRDELPNIRALRSHLVEARRFDELVEISVALHLWSHSRNVTEVLEWSDEVHALDGLGPVAAARAAAVASQAAWARGQYERIASIVGQVIDADVDAWATNEATISLVAAEFFAGRLDRAIELGRDLEDDHAVVMIVTALAHAYQGDEAGAHLISHRLRSVATTSGWPTALAWAEYLDGEMASMTDDAGAETHLRRCVEIAEPIGADFTVGVAQVTLAGLLARIGDVAGAAQSYVALIAHWRRIGGWTQLWTTLRNAADLLEPYDPALALLALERAALDPLAPGLVGAAAEELATVRGRLIDQLDAATLERVHAEAVSIERGRMADRVAVALTALADRRSEGADI